MAMTRWCS